MDGEALDSKSSSLEQGEKPEGTTPRRQDPAKVQWTTELNPSATPTGGFTGGQAYVNAWRKRVIKEPASESSTKTEAAAQAAPSQPTSIAAASDETTAPKNLAVAEQSDLPEMLGNTPGDGQNQSDIHTELLEIEREKTQDELLAEVLQWTPKSR